MVYAYAPALSAPFVFDDRSVALENPSLDSWGAAFIPPNDGRPVTGRPFANLTFALDRRLHGDDPAGFRVTNVALHIAAALLLLSIVRRTLERIGAASSRAVLGAVAAAAAWALHPLQTASVTYISQRTEILAALFAFVSLLSLIRRVEPNGTRYWSVIAVVACALAMTSKETAAALPVLLLAYDRTFISGALRVVWRERRALHLALASTWFVLLALLLTHGDRGGSAGFGAPEVSAWHYLLTQTRAITRYLELAIWPLSQVFDYGTSVVRDLASVAVPIALVALGLLATVIGVRRNHALGFVGLCFFAWLAPSSSVIPVLTQTMGEHRVYLPLAALVAGVVGVSAAQSRLPDHALLLVLLALSVPLVSLTRQRNAIYTSEIALWNDTVTKVPDNSRAHYNLGRAYALASEPGLALDAFARTLALDPIHARAHDAMGNLLAAAGRSEEALERFDRAIALEPRFPDARINRGALHESAGRFAAAIVDYSVALEVEPDAADARINLAAALIAARRPVEALAILDADRARRLSTLDLAERVADLRARAHMGVGMDHARAGRWDSAAAAFTEAIEHAPTLAAAHANLGNVRLQQHDPRAAIEHYQTALRLQPGLPGIAENLAAARAALHAR
ncbi:hypothetical protein ASA1KI_18570 [Opitutales bacterium ASA1]|nr:hypothetical protein ASA1KI_18570 [Opitutales bacterium ASA1]